MQYPLPIARLIDSYTKLLDIGEKTVTRLALCTVDMSKDDVEDFSKSLMQVKENLHSCFICGNTTKGDPYEICRGANRDHSTIMVIKQPKDVTAFGEMGEYNGLYHALHDVLSSMDGAGPEGINIEGLIIRLQEQDKVKEITLALNSSPGDEATAVYSVKLIKPAGLKVMRLAVGLTVGSDVEYANLITLKRAAQERMDL